MLPTIRMINRKRVSWNYRIGNRIPRKRTSFSSTFLLYSVYSANSHRERERLQGTNVIIDLSRHNERSRARFSNPSLPPLALSKTPRILLELASPVPEEFAIQLGREYYWVKGEEYLEEY